MVAGIGNAQFFPQIENPSGLFPSTTFRPVTCNREWENIGHLNVNRGGGSESFIRNVG